MVPDFDLSTGAKIPAVGFGLWKNKDREECIQSIKDALDAGYRHFDTAQAYGNEHYLAEALKQAGIKREEVYITSKIAVLNFVRVNSSFKTSLKKLETDYVDLMLLHFPITYIRKHAWKALEKIHESGQAKTIGVSNYTVRHLEELLKDCKIKPAVNQVEIHVFLQQPELIEYCYQQGILVEAYSPLAHGYGLDNPLLAELATKYSKTPAQIMLRWCVQIGTLPLPKSVHADRIKSNFEIFDFEITVEDMAKLKTLEQNHRTMRDPTNVK